MDTSAPVEQPAKVFKCEEHGEYVVIEARANTDQQADSKLVTEPHCKTEGQHCSPRPRVEGLDDSPEQEVGNVWLWGMWWWKCCVGTVRESVM